MAKDRRTGVLHADWVNKGDSADARQLNETPRLVENPEKLQSSFKTFVGGPSDPGLLSDRAKGSRYWLKAHGDDWIERALMGDLMDYRAKLIHENGAGNRMNPYRTTNLARRLQIHNSAMSQWANLRQFPKSFASWRRLCRALGLSLEIRVRDKEGNVIFEGTR